MNRKQQDTIKINEYILFGQKSKLIEAIDKSMINKKETIMNEHTHNKFLKEVYKKILREDATKYNQMQQPEITRPEKGGVINRVPDMLSSTQMPDVTQRVQRDAMPPTNIQNMGNGWWKIDGKWYFFGGGWRPIGKNEHGDIVLDSNNSDRERPDFNKQPKDRWDRFPKNPNPGDFTRIRGQDGKYHYYRFHPPGVWIHYEENEYAPIYTNPKDMPLPPNPDNSPTQGEIPPVWTIPGHNFGDGVGGGLFPMWDEQYGPAGFPRPGQAPSELPSWPSPVNNPADPVLAPPVYQNDEYRPFWIAPYPRPVPNGGSPTDPPNYPWYPDWGYPRPEFQPDDYRPVRWDETGPTVPPRRPFPRF